MAVERVEGGEYDDKAYRASWAERAVIAFVLLLIAGALASFIAYHFVKLHDYHQQKMQRDCWYYNGGNWDGHACHPGRSFAPGTS